MSKPLFSMMMLLSIQMSAQPRDAVFEKLVFTSESGTLPYRFLKPDKPDPEKKFPLIIFLHGAGERGTDNEAQIRHIAPLFLNSENRSRYPCYVVAPQCPEGTMWARHDREGSRLVMRSDPAPAMAILLELLSKIEAEFPVDRERIYVTGLSMGGFGTWDLIARFPDRFAAAVPICGGGDPRTAPAIKHIPVWAFHGALDRVVVPQQSRVMIEALHEVGAKPGYTEYPDVGHNSWSNAYDDPYLLPWLFDQRLEKKSDRQ